MGARAMTDQEYKAALRNLVKLAKKPHYNCPDDTWFGCPMSVDGCSNDNIPKKCNCGADEHNALVDALAKELGIT